VTAARWAAAGVLLVVLLGVLVALPLTVFPESVAVPREADVVVVLAGGDGERHATARMIMDRAVGPPADLLLLAEGGAPGRPEVDDLCGTAEPRYAIACFTPDPATTAGAARAIGDLAAAQRWERVAVVTSTYHVTRARLRIERCTDAEVLLIGAAPDLGVLQQVRVSAREMAALARDALDAGEC
jgi:uncharacterized SAM-binding protein YcdF (DUF218 family)